MDLSELPFDVPVILQSVHLKKNLQSPFGSKRARCLHDNKDAYEEVILRRVGEDKVAIESARNGRFLQARTNGSCYFDAKEAGAWEYFTIETDTDCRLYFVSCHTGNTLQCTDKGVARCSNGNRGDWEAWRIMQPRAAAGTILPQSAPAFGRQLGNAERMHLILELARCGKTPDEIEQIVTHLFDVSSTTPTLVSAPDSTYAVLVDKE
ncbi:hypothetical protein BBJ28_00024955 [Nothophytophthora sp. Chile5]|nr:hypothetical protein BBJ28_00024955 [Nothophytophthora sp. Chile5]